MKKLLLALLSLSTLTWGCKDDDNQPAIDEAAILAYIEANNLTAIEDPSGLYYVITQEGTGDNPAPNATVTVRYKGYLLDGTVFDQTPGSTTATFNLQGLIEGWRIAIPKLKRGGKGIFIHPSRLAYGRSGSGSIPGNSVLVFEIDLVDF